MTEIVLLEQQEKPPCPRCGSTQHVISHGIKEKRWFCKFCNYHFRQSIPKIKTCPTCGKEFKVSSTENKSQIYCSVTCRPSFNLQESRAYNKPSVPRIKPCPVCGTQFQSANWYCSFECRTKARQQREAEKSKELKLNRPQVACLWCKDWFKQKHPKHLFDISECNLSFRGMERNIKKQFEDDFNRQQAELAKLHEQGKAYKLPERESA